MSQGAVRPNATRSPFAAGRRSLTRDIVPSRAMIDAKSREIDRKLDELERQALRIQANMRKPEQGPSQP